MLGRACRPKRRVVRGGDGTVVSGVMSQTRVLVPLVTFVSAFAFSGIASAQPAMGGDAEPDTVVVEPADEASPGMAA